MTYQTVMDFSGATAFEPATSEFPAQCEPLATLVGTQAARQLVDRFGGLAEAVGADVAAIERAAGKKAARVLAAVQAAATALAADRISQRCVLSSWAALLAYAKTTMAGASREQFRVLFLDKRNRLIIDEVMNEGTVDHAPVYPREVMRRALEVGASAIILAHNHPSGDPTPSSADIKMTRQVVDAGKVMGVVVHDHIVVGREGVASLKALGLF